MGTETVPHLGRASLAARVPWDYGSRGALSPDQGVTGFDPHPCTQTTAVGQFVPFAGAMPFADVNTCFVCWGYICITLNTSGCVMTYIWDVCAPHHCITMSPCAAPCSRVCSPRICCRPAVKGVTSDVNGGQQ